MPRAGASASRGGSSNDATVSSASAGAEPERASAAGSSEQQVPGQPPAAEPLAGLEPSYRKDLTDVPSHRRAMADRYADLRPAACRMEVRRRKLAAISDHGLAIGISDPMRITGPLHGVRFVAPGPKSVHGKLDCRLLLLLDELSATLAELGVKSVHVDGFYRPKAHLPGKKSPSQHSFGLAVDIHALGLEDGRTLVIERDFSGRIGAPVCGAEAELTPETRDAIELRNIVCAMARAHAFHYLLTPNHDPSHRNHLHGDIKRGGREHVVR